MIRDTLTSSGWETSNALDEAVEWFKIDFEYGEGADTLSLRHFSDAEEFNSVGGGEKWFLVNDQRGMKEIIKALAS